MSGEDDRRDVIRKRESFSRDQGVTSFEGNSGKHLHTSYFFGKSYFGAKSGGTSNTLRATERLHM